MHHLIVMFYAFVFSFTPAKPAPQPADIPLALQAANSATYAPTRHELERSSYAETGCVSCRQTMNVSYRVR